MLIRLPMFVDVDDRAAPLVAVDGATQLLAWSAPRRPEATSTGCLRDLTTPTQPYRTLSAGACGTLPPAPGPRHSSCWWNTGHPGRRTDCRCRHFFILMFTGYAAQAAMAQWQSAGDFQTAARLRPDESQQVLRPDRRRRRSVRGWALIASAGRAVDHEGHRQLVVVDQAEDRSGTRRAGPSWPPACRRRRRQAPIDADRFRSTSASSSTVTRSTSSSR